MTEYAVQTRGLSRSFGAVTAVDSLDLEIRTGEIYGFLGPNGAGKTTAMRMLLGLTTPTGGTASVLGHPPGTPRALARTGLLIEEPALYPYLSGRDNLRAVGRYTSVAPGRADRLLETVGLGRAADRRVATYSLGMRQRLGVAMALLKDPDLLVLDEPTNGLDPAGVIDMRELISSVAAEGRTVLLSSHALGEIEQICHRVGVLSEGRLVAHGTVAELRGEGAVLVAATPAERALELLDAHVGTHRVTPTPDGVLVRVPRDQAAAVNRLLVEAGVEVCALSWQERSLVEAFFALTAPVDDAGTP